MKMLMFDFRETEKEFFYHNEFSDFDITFIGSPLNENTELTEEQTNETVIISVYISSNLTEKVLSKFHNLRIIAARSYGYSHIDLDYCIKHNIAVVNVEQYGAEAAAQYTFSLMVSLTRNMIPAIIGMKKHLIDYKHYEGRLLNNMKIGLVGCGEIGAIVAKIAAFFGMKILIYSYMHNPAWKGNFADMDELLREADIISLHLPYTGDNYHIIGSKEFEKMKNGVYIINISRGELLDIKALYDNLIKGKVKAAALDVLECEFLSTHPGELTDVIQNSASHCVETALIVQKLSNMENVIITPHLAYNTNESVNYLLNTTFNNIRDYFKGIYSNRVC